MQKRTPGTHILEREKEKEIEMDSRLEVDKLETKSTILQISQSKIY